MKLRKNTPEIYRLALAPHTFLAYLTAKISQIYELWGCIKIRHKCIGGPEDAPENIAKLYKDSAALHHIKSLTSFTFLQN